MTTILTPDGKWSIEISVSAVAPAPPATPPATSSAPAIPSTATTVDLLPVTSWAMNHDAGTPGSSVGTTSYPSPLNGATVRRFDFTDTDHGGEIYHVDVLPDATAFHNFCYDAVFESPDWSNVENLEMDLNHVLANGNVIIIGQQLAGASGTAELTDTVNGTHWLQSNVKANPSKFSANVPHTIRWFSKDDGVSQVTYLGVEIDGVYTAFTVNNVVTSEEALNWAKNLLQLQLQFDGAGSGSIASTVYASKLQVHAW